MCLEFDENIHPCKGCKDYAPNTKSGCASNGGCSDNSMVKSRFGKKSIVEDTAFDMDRLLVKANEQTEGKIYAAFTNDDLGLFCALQYIIARNTEIAHPSGKVKIPGGIGVQHDKS